MHSQYRDDDQPKDHCGVFGIAHHPEAASLTRLGLHALQHRGQESAGIYLLREEQRDAHSEPRCELQKGMGLVAEVFRRLPKEWWKTPQSMAIGHVRYSTAGGSNLVNAQPFAVEFDRWQLGLAHNGTLSNAEVIRSQLKRSGAILQGTTDTELILHLAARHHEAGASPWCALKAALRHVDGAYSLLALCEDGMAAIRDPYGWRPLVMGRLDKATVFCSETCALDLIGAEYVRDVQPGEMILVRPDGSIHSEIVATARRLAHCIFELVYFARPDSLVFGECVYRVRRAFGARLAEEAPVPADVVMPVPDGGVYAALGYAETSGLPFDLGIMRNHYVGRTFIQPSAEERASAARAKLNPIRNAIKGKRIVLVDDSIVRGNTARQRVHLLRSQGAKEVHMRISCPPHVGPCYYGIDFPDPNQLIANHLSLEEIAKEIHVDTLAYLSLEGMLGCVEASPASDYCHACFSRQYPVNPKFCKPPPALGEAPQQPTLFGQ